VNPHHRDKEEARRRRKETGQPYAAALVEVRRDREAHRARLDDSAASEPPNHDDVPTPKVLVNLLRYQVSWIARYLHEALDNSRFFEQDFAEWQRLVLYKLTDGLEHHLLLIGTIARFLQEEGVPLAYLRRYLQVRDDRGVNAFMTPGVSEHLAGLKGSGQPEEAGSHIWYLIGKGIAAQDRWCDPERENALEIFLTALFTNYADDDQALDHLPEELRHRVLTLLPHREGPLKE
jgi:hypothetical protein